MIHVSAVDTELRVIVSLIQINALSQVNVFLSLYSILFLKKNSSYRIMSWVLKELVPQKNK